MEHWLPVESGGWVCDTTSCERKNDASENLDCPSRIQKVRFVAALILNDCGSDTNIAEHSEALHKYSNECHQPKGFRNK
ncbi:MAG: hypothetical protein Aurels2KO_38200 [Aureliella sp.]